MTELEIINEVKLNIAKSFSYIKNTNLINPYTKNLYKSYLMDIYTELELISEEIKEDNLLHEEV